MFIKSVDYLIYVCEDAISVMEDYFNIKNIIHDLSDNVFEKNQGVDHQKESVFPLELLKKSCVGWIDLNVCKMPLTFFGTIKKQKEMLSKTDEITLLSSSISHHNQHMTQSLKIQPDRGLLTPFDDSVKMVVFHCFSKIREYKGTLPKTVCIPMSIFPYFFNVKKDGRLYDNIKNAVRRISALKIINQHVIFVKNDNGSKELFEEGKTELFRDIGYVKETHTFTEKNKHISYDRAFLKLEVPD